MFTDLFQIQSHSQEGESHRWEVALNPESGIFKVHFPGNPIMPGACQLEMFRQLAGEALGKDVDIASVNNIKYLALIDPRGIQRFAVTGTFAVTEGATKCTVVVSSDEKTYTKASLTLK